MWPFNKKSKIVTVRDGLEAMLANTKKYGWNKQVYAKSALTDKPVSWYSKEAGSFCVVGLVFKTTEDQKSKKIDDALSRKMQISLEKAVVEMGYKNVNLFKYNDSIAQSKEDIVTLIKKAIELEQG